MSGMLTCHDHDQSYWPDEGCPVCKLVAERDDALAWAEKAEAERDGLADKLIAEAEARAEARLADALLDPLVVHLNMVAGKIAKPLSLQLVHIYGEDAIRAAAATIRKEPTEYERKVAKMKEDFPNGI